MQATALAVRSGHRVTGADATGRDHRLDYAGRTKTLFGIFFKNLLLTIVTLGIYRFWAKTRERRFLWGNTLIDGEALEYTGTGKELFVGFLKAVAILVPLLVALELIATFLFAGDLVLMAAFGAVRSVLLVALIYAGTFAARRYRMSRTTWRGIRFQQNGSMWRYAGTALVGIALSLLTLGLYYPFLQTRLMRYELDNLRFGSAAFRFAGSAKTLFRSFMRVWLFAVVVLAALGGGASLTGTYSFVQVMPLAMIVIMGLSLLWYQARVYRFQAENTYLGGLRFAMPELTGWRMFRLVAGNYLLTLVSLGLLTPLVMQRVMRFWIYHLRISGDVDLARIAQAERGPASGEGLAGFFDIDVGA